MFGVGVLPRNIAISIHINIHCDRVLANVAKQVMLPGISLVFLHRLLFRALCVGFLNRLLLLFVIGIHDVAHSGKCHHHCQNQCHNQSNVSTFLLGNSRGRRSCHRKNLRQSRNLPSRNPTSHAFCPNQCVGGNQSSQLIDAEWPLSLASSINIIKTFFHILYFFKTFSLRIIEFSKSRITYSLTR